jgi:hypothetical protein
VGPVWPRAEPIGTPMRAGPACARHRLVAYGGRIRDRSVASEATREDEGSLTWFLRRRLPQPPPIASANVADPTRRNLSRRPLVVPKGGHARGVVGSSVQWVTRVLRREGSGLKIRDSDARLDHARVIWLKPMGGDASRDIIGTTALTEPVEPLRHALPLEQADGAE